MFLCCVPCEDFALPPFDGLLTGSWCAAVEFTIVAFALLWVGSEVFKPNPSSIFGAEVGKGAHCCCLLLSTGGIGL